MKRVNEDQAPENPLIPALKSTSIQHSTIDPNAHKSREGGMTCYAKKSVCMRVNEGEEPGAKFPC